MQLLRILVFFLFVSGVVNAQSADDKPQLPPGVNYKVASAEVNATAKSLLQKALVGDEAAWEQLFSDGPETCGPMLWQALKPIADGALLDTKPITIVVPTPAAVTTEGRGLLTDDARHAFWKALLGKYPALVNATIRKAKASEISYYWSTIPFDIEEPFFALDAGSNVFIVNLRYKNGKTSLFWIDLVGDPRLLTAQKPSDETTKNIVDKLSDSVETQSPKTMFRAGKAYITGDGVAADVEKGRNLLDRAAHAGVIDAQMFLGFAYFSGKYLTQDRARAAPYLLMAADQGNAMAQFYVGMMYLQGAGLEKSGEKAMPYLQKAADQNFAPAQYNLGAMYFQGISIAPDKARACALYGKAADQGQLEAINDLAWCYQQGTGVEKDSAKAMALYTKAAEKGHPRSQGNLAMMYVAAGEWDKAYIWLRIAENAGGTEARPAIENAKKHLTQAQIDLAEAKVLEWSKEHPHKP